MRLSTEEFNRQHSHGGGAGLELQDQLAAAELEVERGG
jgi:hypothetical protein